MTNDNSERPREDPASRNPGEHRLSPLVALACAVIGMSAGVLIQLWRSRLGYATVVLPYSLTASMLVLAAVLIVLGIRIRRAVTGKKKRHINPFGAVRLLAAARAGQCVGALLGGISAGLLFIILFRTVSPPLQVWLPTAAALIAGIVLTVAGMITEQLCKIPPTEDDESDNGNTSPADGHPVTGYTSDESDPQHYRP